MSTTYALPLSEAQVRLAAIRPMFRANRTRDIQDVNFPREGRRQPTRNRWVMGWSPSLRTYCAVNNRGRGKRFATAAQLQRFANAMRRWDWNIQAVA